MNHKIYRLSFKIILLSLTALTALNSCGGGGGSTSSGNDPVNPITPPSSAYISASVSPNYNSGGVCSNVNTPCVSVTVCEPSSPTSCVTINNVLIDSGSYGLRVFSTELGSVGSNLQTESTDDGRTIAECVNYADGSANWGPVARAKIVIGSESTIDNIPMQIINSSFGTLPFACQNAADNSSPDSFGFNGVLGVGPLITDGGDYYGCSDSTCTQTSIPVESEVANPIAFLKTGHENGVTFEFTPVGSSGGSNAYGYAIYGVGTESDNTPSSSVNIYPITIQTSGVSITMPTTSNDSYLANVSLGFLDTGSNGLFFTDATGSIPLLSNTWYNPTTSLTLSVSNNGIPLSFSIANASALFATSNSAFNNLGGTLGSSMSQYLDYGLPFFLGNTVYICFNGKTCSGESGPYWAF
ncbi:MAG: hypothetical protein QG673_251 [Pseudomonadota bacterium]|nr:hypothetical protein [Pseudomonadota bacterium]